MSVRARATGAFGRLPAGLRRQLLHGLGRYAPWEDGFDFTPPPPGVGEDIGSPDFVGIGVQKAGTTWWYHLLVSHPDVAEHPTVHKERHFFDRFATAEFGSEDAERYRGWFPRPADTVTGEWTPDYFSQPRTPELLVRAAPDAKLLLLLRDPVERYRSGVAHDRRMGAYRRERSEAVALERGFYRRWLDLWLQSFDRQQLLVLQFEQCVLDPVGQYLSTLEFLGLDEFHPDHLQLTERSDQRPQDSLPIDERRRLVQAYESDVLALAERLPGLDLRLWPNFAYLVDGSGATGANSPTRRP